MTRKRLAWSDYAEMYLAEMAASEEAQDYIGQLARMVAEGKTVTLLCSTACKDAMRCHRSLLRELVEAEVARLQVPVVG